MPVSDLLGKRVRTVSGVEVSAPTVRAFFRALEVYGGEIAAVRAAARQIEGRLSVDLAIAPFLMDPNDGRLAYVLEGLVKPAFYTEGVAMVMGAMVQPLAGRIDEMLGPPEAEPGEEGDVEAGVLYVLGVAERLKIDPMAVMDWPLGLFLDATQAFSGPSGEASPQAGPPPGFPTLEQAG
jgi:hypothetical protein